MKRKIPKALKVVAGVVITVAAVYAIAVAVLTLISPKLNPIEEDDDFFDYEEDDFFEDEDLDGM